MSDQPRLWDWSIIAPSTKTRITLHSIPVINSTLLLPLCRGKAGVTHLRDMIRHISKWTYDIQEQGKLRWRHCC